MLCKMAESPKRPFNDVESNQIEERPAKRRKVRNSIMHLAELRPGTLYSMAGQYGSVEEPIYVMQLTIDDKVFQGIGPSKKKSKLMAAEFALVHLGAIKEVSELISDISKESYCWEDFTADLADSNSSLYFDFSHSTSGQAASCAIGGDTNECTIGQVWGDGNSFALRMIGKNTMAILKELRPDASYWPVSSVVDANHTKFVMAVKVDAQCFRGTGINKRLAKARAAREALRKLYSMEFGTAEDGMPVYEGDETIWLKYKAKLEEEAESKLDIDSGKNPVQQLNEYFPDAKYTFSDTNERPDIASFFICIVSIESETYEGSGLSKKDAKSHAAAMALEALKEKGILEKKDVELEAKRLEREQKKKSNEKLKGKDTEHKAVGFKTAVAKLNDNFQNVDYKLIAETPLKNTCITAFTMAINIKGKNYIGVGKNKKMAKLDAAEKALRNLELWTEEDDQVKERMKTEEDDSEYDQRRWVPEQGQRGWVDDQGQSGWSTGSMDVGYWGTGSGSTNWHDQYAMTGSGYDSGWGGQYAGGQANNFGSMAEGFHGNSEGFQPVMMQELNAIMGSMFESTFGSNPFQCGSGSTTFRGPTPRLPNKSGSSNRRPGRGFRGNLSHQGSSGFLGNFQGFGDNPVDTGTPSSLSSSYPTPPSTSGNETYSGTQSLSKYQNFRSAGFETGFNLVTSSQSNTTISSSQTQSFLSVPSKYGPYGTPLTQPSDTDMNQTSRTFTDSSVQSGSKVSSYELSSISQIGGTGNQTATTFHGTNSNFVMGSDGNVGTEKYQVNAMGNMATSASSYSMNNVDGYRSGNSTDCFQTNNTGNYNYRVENFPPGMSGFQVGSSSYLSGATGYGNQASESSMQSASYQGNQLDYSSENFPNRMESTTGRGYSAENSGHVSYSACPSGQYYGMYGGSYNQGHNYSYGYGTGYGADVGYGTDGSQGAGTNSSYGYGYPPSTSGINTDSYTSTVNKMSW